MLDEYTRKLGKTKFRLTVAGGEPTLWKDLEKFISLVKEKHNVYFTIASNGSRTIRWWEEYGQTLDNAHLSHHLDQGNVEHITNVADILYSKNVKTTVKILMDPKLWDQGISDIEYMKTNSKHPWFIQTARVIGADKEYTPEQIDALNTDLKRMPDFKWFWRNRRLLKAEIKLYDSIVTTDTGENINARPGLYINNDWNNFLNWQCSVGLDRLYISWKGNLAGACGSKLFGLDDYFNILSEDFKQSFVVNPIPTTCVFARCDCMPDNHITKTQGTTAKVIPILAR
jgi:organic radical activating enzyme